MVINAFYSSGLMKSMESNLINFHLHNGGVMSQLARCGIIGCSDVPSREAEHRALPNPSHF